MLSLERSKTYHYIRRSAEPPELVNLRHLARSIHSGTREQGETTRVAHSMGAPVNTEASR